MIEAVIDVQGSTLKTVQGLLRSLLESGLVEALLVPMVQAGGSVAPTLVAEAGALERADPLAPVLPINAARAVSQLTMTGQGEKLGVVLRACEIRALVELVKFQQARLEEVVIVGLDCLGAYSVRDYQAVGEKEQAVGALLAGGRKGEVQPLEGLAFREGCRMCEQPLPVGEHVALSIGLVGVAEGQVYLQAREGVAEALGLEGGGAPEGRKAAVEKLIGGRREAREEAIAGFRERVAGRNMEGLLDEFSACIRCYNCMVNCPICYCRECIFRTPTFEHESGLYYQWAARKGTVRMLPDRLLFHLTRLNHMATSCVGCGVCSEACPVEIAVATVFGAVGERVQALFDYHPGRSLEEAAPVQEFREDELTALGERPH